MNSKLSRTPPQRRIGAGLYNIVSGWKIPDSYQKEKKANQSLSSNRKEERRKFNKVRL